MKFKILLFFLTLISTELITPQFRVHRQIVDQTNLKSLQKNLKQTKKERQLEMDLEAEQNYLEAQENNQESHHVSRFGLPIVVTVGSALAAFHNLKKNKQLLLHKIMYLEQKEKLALENIIARTEQFEQQADTMKQSMVQLRGGFERFKVQVLKALNDIQNANNHGQLQLKQNQIQQYGSLIKKIKNLNRCFSKIQKRIQKLLKRT